MRALVLLLAVNKEDIQNLLFSCINLPEDSVMGGPLGVERRGVVQSQSKKNLS